MNAVARLGSEWIQEDTGAKSSGLAAWRRARRRLALTLALALMAISGAAAAGEAPDRARADLANLQILAELSRPEAEESEPAVTRDERAIVFRRTADLLDPAAETFAEATRAAATLPFSGETSAPFTALLSAARERTPRLSEDRLRLFFASDRAGRFGLYVAEREAPGGVFAAPLPLSVNAAGADDTQPCLARDGRDLFFLSDRDSPGIPRVFHAERSASATLAAEFGPAVRLDEIPAGYTPLDVSEDALALLLRNDSTGALFAARRDSPDAPFAPPAPIHLFAAGELRGASLAGSAARLYFGAVTQPGDPLAVDLAVADFSFAPAVTPSPTPTPPPPAPLPLMVVEISRDQIAALTEDAGNPRGAAFDSAGRFLFFDQRALVSGGGTIGSNRLLRATLGAPGAPPALEILATEADLAAADPRWARGENWPALAGLAALGDGSAVLLGSTPAAEEEQRLLRVAPGNPPAVTALSAFRWGDLPGNASGAPVEALAVDSSGAPEWIVLAAGPRIYRLAANTPGALPSLWATAPFPGARILDLETAPAGYDYGQNSVYFAGEGLDNIYRYYSAEGSTTPILEGALQYGLSELGNPGARVEAFAIDPASLESPPLPRLICLCAADSPWPGSASRKALFRMTRNFPGRPWTPWDFVRQEPVFADPDIAPWISPWPELTAPGGGMAISPLRPGVARGWFESRRAPFWRARSSESDC